MISILILFSLLFTFHDESFKRTTPQNKYTNQQKKGITYSVLSASWDDDREGSTFGADEFSKNMESLREGLSRTKENALLRERMAGMSDEEIKRIVDSDK